MSYIGQQPVTGDNNSFRILDSISSYTQTFDGSSSAVVSTANSTLTFTGHRFITGQRVTYSTTGTTIGGLSSGSVYYIIKTDQNTLKLASSYVNALASTSITLTSLGVGSTHTLNVAFDSINTKFKATFNNGTKGLITRAAQLNISINGVIQQPQDTTTPTNGFGIEADSTIVFFTAPAVSDAFWGSLVATNFATFDVSDNTVDSFTGNASQTNFVLSKTPANNQNVLVTINGVVQYPSDATNIRAYSVTGNVLIFVEAPAGGSLIQVRHIGFAGATSSSVTGFYGRTGNVGLNTSDTVSIGSAYVSGNIGIGTTNPTANLQVGVGTAGSAPLKLTAGTNLTTAQAGAIEYDGTVFYATPNQTSGRGILSSQSCYRIGNTAITGNTGTSAQNALGVLANVNSSTVYQFEYLLAFSKPTGTNTHNFVFRFLNGTATVNNILLNRVFYQTTSFSASTFTANVTAYSDTFTYSNVAQAPFVIVAFVSGTVGIATGGTIGPQYTLSTNPGGAYSTISGSYFSIWPIGIGTANLSVGQWT
jgi:hypothetical protein